MSRPDLLLSNQLCFLFYRMDRAIMARYRPVLEALGLTYPQYLAMLVMWERRSVTVGGLCAALTLDTGTVSPLLKRMEKAGLVRRSRSRDDERTVVVELTPRGASLEEKAASVPGELARCMGLSTREYQEVATQVRSLLLRAEGGRAGLD